MKAVLTRFSGVVALTLSFLFSTAAMAGKRNLIDYDDGQATAQLAKSWKKVKDGEYEFTLDTSKEVQSGVKVSAEVVKSSLEDKLAKKYGVKVTAKGADGITVTYTCDEPTFLEKVAKTKIRGAGGDNLALESSVSEGGIRANKMVRPPNNGEVKAQVVKLGKGWVQVMVNTSKSAKIKGGAHKVDLGGSKVAVGNAVVFTPSAKNGDVWKVEGGKEVLVGK